LGWKNVLKRWSLKENGGEGENQKNVFLEGRDEQERLTKTEVKKRARKKKKGPRAWGLSRTATGKKASGKKRDK